MVVSRAFCLSFKKIDLKYELNTNHSDLNQRNRKRLITKLGVPYSVFTVDYFILFRCLCNNLFILIYLFSTARTYTGSHRCMDQCQGEMVGGVEEPACLSDTHPSTSRRTVEKSRSAASNLGVFRQRLVS